MSEEKSGDDFAKGSPFLYWGPRKELHFRDLIVFVTWFVFYIGPLLGTGIVLDKCFFHFAPRVPLRDQPSSDLFMVLWIAVGVPLSLVGSRLWLLVMSRLLTRADVAPLVAYGLPRRLSRLDQALLRHYYRR